ncbi:MalY/PatB family protein [Microbulbifer sp. ANSA001]|uniref:MalY/PatB family protein n=1 Tax=Microbulbifer sp. ANSA001 TaxID=3243358 RepID=UPI00404353F5
MMDFDKNNSGAENHFVRNSPSALKNIFGTEKVTPFWVADMDFNVADPIRAELQRLVDRGQFAYEFYPEGIFSAISSWYQRRHNLRLETDKFVQVTGVLTGIALLIRELTEKGNSVLVQPPVYHQFSKVIQSAGRKIVKSPLRMSDGRYRMNFTDLDKQFADPEVKAMILCNPHNPVGRVWQKEELEKLLQLANKYNVTIISDEIHGDIIYSGHQFTSLMALDSEKHVALIGSPAKTFGMQSISNGYIYTQNSRLLQAVSDKSESMYLNHGNAFTTFATIAAFEKGDAWLDQLLAYLQDNLGWIKEFLLEELSVVKMTSVEGTYQVWLDFSETGFAGSELTTKLAEAGFGASPGTWFDDTATQFVRMNFAVPRADIKKAFLRLKEVFAKPNTSSGSSAGDRKCCGCCD